MGTPLKKLLVRVLRSGYGDAINTFFQTPNTCFHPTKGEAFHSHILILNSEYKWIEKVLCLVRYLPQKVLEPEIIHAHPPFCHLSKLDFHSC